MKKIAFIFYFLLQMYALHAQTEFNYLARMSHFQTDSTFIIYGNNLFHVDILNSNEHTDKLDFKKVKLYFHIHQFKLNEDEFNQLNQKLKLLWRSSYQISSQSFGFAVFNKENKEKIDEVNVYLPIVFNTFIKNGKYLNEFEKINFLINNKITKTNLKKKWSFDKGRYMEIYNF